MRHGDHESDHSARRQNRHSYLVIWCHWSCSSHPRPCPEVPSPSPRLTRLYILFTPVGIEPLTSCETMGEPCALAGSLCDEIRQSCHLYCLYIFDCAAPGVDQGGSCYSRRTSHNPVDLNMLCESSTVSSPISATRSNQNHAVLYMHIDSRCVQIQVLQQYIIRAYCTAQLRAP